MSNGTNMNNIILTSVWVLYTSGVHRHKTLENKLIYYFFIFKFLSSVVFSEFIAKCQGTGFASRSFSEGWGQRAQGSGRRLCQPKL
jgi:hypothetical protein